MTDAEPDQTAQPSQPQTPPEPDPQPVIPPEMPAKSEWIERGNSKLLERRDVD